MLARFVCGFVLHKSITEHASTYSVQILPTSEQDPRSFVLACGRLIQVIIRQQALLLKTQKAIYFQNKISLSNVIKNTFLLDLSIDQEEEEKEVTISLLQSHGDSTLIGVVDSTIIKWNVKTGQSIGTH